MELEKIERLKELIDRRDTLLVDIKRIESILNSAISPQYISLEWGSGYIERVNIPHGTSYKIKEFLFSLLKEELESVNNSILKL